MTDQSSSINVIKLYTVYVTFLDHMFILQLKTEYHKS